MVWRHFPIAKCIPKLHNQKKDVEFIAKKHPTRRRQRILTMIPRSNLESFLLVVYQLHKQEERISEATNDEGDEELFFSLVP